MTALAASVDSVFDFNEPGGPKGGTVKFKSCKVAFNIAAGTYAQADGCTILRSAIATAIQNSQRNGKTVTVLDFGPAEPGKINGATIVSAYTFTGTTTVKFLLATSADYSTQLADGTGVVANALDEPVTAYVTFTESK